MSAAALDIPKFVPKVDLQADYNTAKVRGSPQEFGTGGGGKHREGGLAQGKACPAHLYVSGGAGCWLPGAVAGAGPAGWAGVDASRVPLGPVSTMVD